LLFGSDEQYIHDYCSARGLAMGAFRKFDVLAFDRWRSATDGLVGEVVRQDTVFFTSLVDASALDELRRGAILRGEPKPSYTALVIKAISLALKAHAEMNRLVLGGVFRHRPVQLHCVDAVVAVERVRGGEDTVYAGILRATDLKSSGRITWELRKLSSGEEAEDARLALFMRLVRRAPGWLCRLLVGLPRLGPKLWIEHRGGAFALTTVGKYGVDSICAKWPWPLTFTYGEVTRRPVVVGDAVVARNSFFLSMGFDRRLCNGAPAARFFHEIVRRLGAADLGEAVPGKAREVSIRVPREAVRN
jgi:pyruvate/2-oxoglutarate dehydrogenase complex dihydrolipoamide acyltransferase (E2) component